MLVGSAPNTVMSYSSLLSLSSSSRVRTPGHAVADHHYLFFHRSPYGFDPSRANKKGVPCQLMHETPLSWSRSLGKLTLRR